MLVLADGPTIDTGNTAWLLASTALVLLMTPGLALFYGGLNRSKSVLNMMMMSFSCIGLISVLWLLYCFSISFGTNDMTADMGIPGDYDNPRVRDAYARAIAAAKKHGKHVGVGGLGSRPKLIAEFVKMGARYVSTGTDLGFLIAAATEQAKQVRALAT